MALYEILDLDSKIFTLKVAKIIPERLTLLELDALLKQLKQEFVQLAYWCSDSQDQVSQKAAKVCQGYLADEKMTFVANLEAFVEQFQNVDCERYPFTSAEPELIDLALESGKFSRFLKDRRIGYDRFKALYTRWINNSCNKSVADDILIKKESEKLVGMITVGKKNNRGDIGLLAVTPSMQGKGIGKQLVRGAQAYFYSKNISTVQVVTQKENEAACCLYEKCNFNLESIQNYFHFWL